MKMIIGGELVDSSDHATKQVVDPGTLEVIDTIPASTAEDVEMAVTSAIEGQKEWNRVPLHKRIDIMRKFRELFIENKEELINLAARELGKTVTAATNEFNSTARIIEHSCNEAATMTGEVLPVGAWNINETDLAVVTREPFGVVACILPYNFPVEMFGTKAVAALLMGNSIVIKPATETPLCNLRMGELLVEAGVTPKAVNVITGSGAVMGDLITNNRGIDALTFTGSTEVGRRIAENCGKNLIHVSLELGGNDALVVLDDCNMDHAVAEAVKGRSGGAGQVCCGNKRILVQQDIKEEFVNKLLKALEDVRPGNQFGADATYGPQVSVRAAMDVETQINQVISEGGKLLCGGHRINETMIEATVVDVTPDNSVASDMEIFGPVWSVIGFDTDDDAIEIANNSCYGLSGGVITENITRGMHIAKSINTGAVSINGTGCYRLPGQPFGGHKDSGIGAEGGKHTLEEMTQFKTITLRGCYR